jgi:hypothetical protein
MKYKSPITYHSKDMANVKVYGKWVKLQGQGHKVKNYGTMKVLVIKNTHMKSLSLTIQKIWPMLKFFESGSNFKVKVTRSKVMILIESSCHKEHTYEIPITYHSKDMTNVKVFKKWFKLQGQGHKVKNFGTNRKVLS